MKGATALRGQAINTRYIQPAMVKLGYIQKGERFGFHSFRHSVATWIQQNTNDVKVAQSTLGHADPKITQEIYVRADFGRALDAVTRMSAIKVVQ